MPLFKTIKNILWCKAILFLAWGLLMILASDAARELISREFSRIATDEILENEFSILEKWIFQNMSYFAILKTFSQK